MKKICVIASDPVGSQMAGPAIRSLELARALSGKFEVTLAIPAETRLPEEGFRKAVYKNAFDLMKIVSGQDAVLVFGFLLNHFPFLRKISAAIIVDIYCPTFFEALINYAHKDKFEQMHLLDNVRRAFNHQIHSGDFFICASEKQRDLWIGMMASLGRINPFNYAVDPSFRSLIDVVPYGLPGEPPVKRQHLLKGVHPAIRKTDYVMLWGGGLYDWLDPITAVRAMEIIVKQRDDVRLFFMGCRHPLKGVEMQIVDEIKDLAAALGLTGKYVLFNDHWVSYQDRADYLLESDFGLSLHKASIETDFSFRTRIMDYLWAELPSVTTEGGCLSDFVRDNDLGIVVKHDDPRDLADNILRSLSGEISIDRIKENIRRVREDYRWNKVIRPLEKFCTDPVKKPDAEIMVDSWTFRSPVYPFRILKAMYRKRGWIGVSARVLLALVMKATSILGRIGHKLAGYLYPK